MVWIWVAIAGAFFQTFRKANQKHLKKDLSANVINWVRYAFGLPFVTTYVCFLYFVKNENIPDAQSLFFLYSFLAGVTQIFGTGLLISIFGRRNFSVSVTYAKTETIQTAIWGTLLFAETLSFLGFFAVFIGFMGVLLISFSSAEKLTFKGLLQSLKNRTAQIGILSGMAFAFTGLFIRQATLNLSGSFIMKAGSTLLCVISIQFLLLLIWLSLRERRALCEITKKWKTCLFVGLTGALGSICWFTAFSMVNVTYVRTVGQIELLFSVLVTRCIFKESLCWTETFGMITIVAGILLVLYSI